MKLFNFFKSKPQKQQKRIYTGANVGRLFNDFVQSSRSPDEEVKAALKILRDRCRDLARNNEYAKRFVNLCKTNVVGDRGVNIQVKARNDNGSFDVIGNDIIERAWVRWGRLGTCTVDGRMNWVDAQRMFIENLARDGEVLVRLVRYPNDFGFAIEFIEPDLLDEQLNKVLENGNKIKMGVEMDGFNRPVAYHILSYHPGDTLYTFDGRKHIRIPAENMLHCYLQERAQQSRGVPPMAVAITGLKMLGGYREAELIAARVAAAKMGVITSPAGELFSGDDTEGVRTPIIDAEPGTFHQLPAGFDIKMFDPTHPTSAFADFEKAILRGIASGLGLSYTSLANDLENVSYSSIRQGTLEDRENWKVLQDFLIQHFVEPVYRRWLMEVMDKKFINIPTIRFDKFAEATTFRAKGWQWVDPLKEINAAVVGLNNGILSMQDVANQYGRDVEETFSQIQADKEMADRFGLTMAFEPFGNKAPATPQIDEAQNAVSQ